MRLPAKVLAKRQRLWDVEDLAERIGVSCDTILQLEKDPLSVKGETLHAYLKYLEWRLKVAKDYRQRTLLKNPALGEAL